MGSEGDGGGEDGVAHGFSVRRLDYLYCKAYATVANALSDVFHPMRESGCAPRPIRCAVYFAPRSGRTLLLDGVEALSP